MPLLFALLFASLPVRPLFADEPPRAPIQSWSSFRGEQIREAALIRDAAEPASRSNIFYLAVDEQEWASLKSLLDGYFDRMSRGLY